MPTTNVPTGTIAAFAGPANKVPKDWTVCDGALYDRTQAAYKPLFEIIGTSWGGDGTNKFAVPDLRGQFLRGISDTLPVDPEKDNREHSRPDLADSGNKGNAVGSKQSYALQSHSHVYNAPIQWADGGEGFSGSGFSSNSGRGGENHTIGPNGGTSSETRPVNAYVYYMIKL